MAKLPRVVLQVETSREFGRNLLAGIVRYARAHGPWSLYKEPGGMGKAMPRKGDFSADAMVIRDASNLVLLRKLNIPLVLAIHCLLYTSPSPRDGLLSRMPSSA